MNNLLTSRTYNTTDHPELRNGGASWYAPSELLEGFKSVVDVFLTNTMNSGGDWQGYIEQKIGKRTYIIMFDQNSNYPRAGYTVYTASHPVLSFEGTMTREEICRLLSED